VNGHFCEITCGNCMIPELFSRGLGQVKYGVVGNYKQVDIHICF
jgi:hypothetical protein